MLRMTLDEMKNVDIRTVDTNSLVDITKIKDRQGQSHEDKMLDHVRQVGNPYCFRVGSVAVKLSFMATTVSLEDRLESLMMKA